MSHLWLKDETDQWAVFLLTRRCSFDQLTAESLSNTEGSGKASLVPTRDESNQQWHLVTELRVRIRVNGLPLMTRIRTLRDRDQISLAGTSAYFSTEERARRIPFPGADRKLFCARCRQELMTGSVAVKCPQCGIWHHQSEELPCWTYAEHCGLCSQPTDLDAAYRWRPGEQW